jgi:hypothetical protein
MVIENNWIERQRIAIKKIRSEINWQGCIYG